MKDHVPNLPERINEKIEVSVAKPEDTRAIQEVFYQTWLATYPNPKYGITIDDIEDHFKDAFKNETLAKRALLIERPPLGQTFLAAKRESQVVGVARIIIESDRNRLKALYVLPEDQGKGIGTALWQEAKHFFKPEFDTVVSVASYNESAIKFYKKLGFELTNQNFTDERFRMKSGSVIPEIEMIIKAGKLC